MTYKFNTKSTETYKQTVLHIKTNHNIGDKTLYSALNYEKQEKVRSQWIKWYDHNKKKYRRQIYEVVSLLRYIYRHFLPCYALCELRGSAERPATQLECNNAC